MAYTSNSNEWFKMNHEYHVVHVYQITRGISRALSACGLLAPPQSTFKKASQGWQNACPVCASLQITNPTVSTSVLKSALVSEPVRLVQCKYCSSMIYSSRIRAHIIELHTSKKIGPLQASSASSPHKSPRKNIPLKSRNQIEYERISQARAEYYKRHPLPTNIILPSGFHAINFKAKVKHVDISVDSINSENIVKVSDLDAFKPISPPIIQ